MVAKYGVHGAMCIVNCENDKINDKRRLSCAKLSTDLTLKFGQNWVNNK